jgi:glycosyltransferase involved in cell wall biosynthesis
MTEDGNLDVRWIVEDIRRPGGVEAVVRQLDAGLAASGAQSEIWSWLPQESRVVPSAAGPFAWWRAKWRVAVSRRRHARAMARRIEEQSRSVPATVFMLDPGSIDVAAWLSRTPNWVLHVHWAPELILRPWQYVIPGSVPKALRLAVGLRMRWIGARNRRALRRARALVTITKDNRHTLKEVNPRTVTIPNPLHVENVRERTNRSMPNVVGCVGRLAWEKGVDVFVRAVPLVSDDGRATRYLVVGTGPMRDQLTAMSDSVAGGRVSMEPWRDDVADLLAAIDVLVVPSRVDAGPQILLEGIAAGCLIVGSDGAGSAKELLVDGELGELVPADDVVALAGAITAMVSRARDGDWAPAARRAAVLAIHDPDRVVAAWRKALAGGFAAG